MTEQTAVVPLNVSDGLNVVARALAVGILTAKAKASSATSDMILFFKTNTSFHIASRFTSLYYTNAKGGVFLTWDFKI